MNRIEETFIRLKARGEKALIPYIMAGDPDLEATARLVPALERSGADIVELGVPFSDPIADGPVIQRAAQRSLKNRTSLHDILRLVRELRGRTEVPVVLMSYANPVLAYGEKAFFTDAAAAGVDGLIVPDLPPEEGRPLMRLAANHGIDCILLAAPTSSRARIKMIGSLTRGFVYYVSVTGITGAALRGLQEVRSRVSEIRRLTRKPVAVGFGVSTPEEAAGLTRVADGVIVGSAIVRRIEEHGDRPGLPEFIGEFVKTLKQSLARDRKAAASGI